MSDGAEKTTSNLSHLIAGSMIEPGTRRVQCSSDKHFFNWYNGGWVRLGPLGTAATNRPIVPAPGDYDGEIGGMIGRRNRSTRRKPVPVPLCPPQTAHAARTRTWAAAVGSQRLTAWATARPLSIESRRSVPVHNSHIYVYISSESDKTPHKYEIKTSGDFKLKVRPPVISDSILNLRYIHHSNNKTDMAWQEATHSDELHGTGETWRGRRLPKLETQYSSG
jgi:hypothetical protein